MKFIGVTMSSGWEVYYFLVIAGTIILVYPVLLNGLSYFFSTLGRESNDTGTSKSTTLLPDQDLENFNSSDTSTKKINVRYMS